MTKMSIFMLILIHLSLTSSLFSQELTNDDKMFFDGYNAGLMALHESKVVDAWIGLNILKKVEGSENYKKSLIMTMNSALYALSFVDRDVKTRPEMLKQLARISSDKMKDFFKKMHKKRIENNWISGDAKKEKRIEWVIKRYIQFGNIYGFKSKE